MRAISLKAERTLKALVALAHKRGGYVHLDNTDGTFMPVVVELLPGDTVSIAHYGELNGDLMRDPEMVFYRGANKRWYPVYFRNDYLGIERASVRFDCNGMPARYWRRTQTEQAIFAATWMQNIREQQGV